jgi:hypothetical protein
MIYSVFGKKIEIVKEGGQWKVFIPGPEGKKRISPDIIIPSGVQEEDLGKYLEDLLHEWSTPENPQVTKLDDK